MTDNTIAWSDLTPLQKKLIILIISLAVVIVGLISLIIFLIIRTDIRLNTCSSNQPSMAYLKMNEYNSIERKRLRPKANPPSTSIAKEELARVKKFIVSLHYIHSDGKDYAYCVGSIVSQYWFLTSSLCLHQKIKPKSLYARAGTHLHNRNGSTHPLINFEIPEWRMEGSQDYYTYRYIGIAQVSRPFFKDGESKPNIIPAVLPQQYSVQERFQPQYDLFTFGWGTYISTRVPPKYKELVAMKSEIYHATATCKNYLQVDELKALRLIENVLCAGNITAPSNDQCNIDAGAPLVYKGVINGVSWSGTSCKNYPTVYSKVCLFVNWSLKHINNKPPTPSKEIP